MADTDLKQSAPNSNDQGDHDAIHVLMIPKGYENAKPGAVPDAQAVAR